MKLKATSLFLGICLAVLAASSIPAHAAQIELAGISYLCMDVRGASIANGTVVQAYTCHGGFDQQWNFVNGQLQGIGTTGTASTCLDVAGNNTSPGALVQLFACNGGKNQQWSINNSGEIIGIQSGLCLTSNGLANQLTMEDCGGANQSWNVY